MAFLQILQKRLQFWKEREGSICCMWKEKQKIFEKMITLLALQYKLAFLQSVSSIAKREKAILVAFGKTGKYLRKLGIYLLKQKRFEKIGALLTLQCCLQMAFLYMLQDFQFCKEREKVFKNKQFLSKELYLLLVKYIIEISSSDYSSQLVM